MEGGGRVNLEISALVGGFYNSVTRREGGWVGVGKESVNLEISALLINFIIKNRRFL